MAGEVERARRLFTVDEDHGMGETGILKPADRVELIRGEIVEMSAIGRRHVAFVDNLTQLLTTSGRPPRPQADRRGAGSSEPFSTTGRR